MNKTKSITGVSVDIHDGAIFVSFERTNKDGERHFGDTYFEHNTPERMPRIYAVQGAMVKRMNKAQV